MPSCRLSLHTDAMQKQFNLIQLHVSLFAFVYAFVVLSKIWLLMAMS